MKRALISIALFLLLGVVVHAQAMMRYILDVAASVVYTDDFNNYTINLTINGQGSWVIADGDIDVKNNGGAKSFEGAENNYNCAYWNESINANQSSQIVAAGLQDYSSPGPAVRISSASGGSYYCWHHELSDASHLVRVVNGSATTLATSTTGWAEDDVLRLEISGDELSCFKNGSLDTTISGDGKYTDDSASKITSGYAGIMNYWQDGGAFGDDWEGGNIE